MKKLIFISVALVLGSHLYAQKTTTPISSLLWEISGNGLKSKSYLFGTFHLMCKEDFAITPILKQKLASCKVLYEEMSDEELGSQMKMLTLLKSDTSLDQLMDSASYEKLSAGFKELTGFPLSFFKNYKPFMASSMMTMKLIDCEETVTPEKEFISIAKKQKKLIKGFETIEDQLGAFNKVPLDTQVKGLLDFVQNIDSIKLMMKAFTNVYKSRNIDSIYTFMQQGGMNEIFETSLLDDRNKKWIPIIEKTVKVAPTFIAVGAGHLCGQVGVINLLKQKGYTVKPIKY